MARRGAAVESCARPVVLGEQFVLWSLWYLALRRLLQLAALRVRSNEFKELEIVVLHHELAVLRRQVARPEAGTRGSRLPCRGQPHAAAIELAVVCGHTTTLLRWHRRLVTRRIVNRCDLGRVVGALRVRLWAVRGWRLVGGAVRELRPDRGKPLDTHPALDRRRPRDRSRNRRRAFRLSGPSCSAP